MAFQKPESGVWLAWDDLQVEVDVKAGLFKKERKRIIHGSRGRARPGEVLAVMGPSGAGKSTLFSCLARRGNEMHVSGQLTLNGLSYDKADLAPISGFVFQDALMHSHIRTHEALRTAAELKLPRSMSKEDKNKRVETLMDAFDLRRCAKTKISGISGGEKKRLSIAIEVLTGPSLFLDEPTTGLDAASSLMILQLLRELANAGTSVILVLHQPRTALLKYIDNFLVLADGRDVFFGPLQNMFPFFESVELPIPLRTNPVDYVLDVINTNEALAELVKPTAQASSGGDVVVNVAGKSFADIMRGEQSHHTFQRMKKESVDMGFETDVPPALATMTRKELALHLSQAFVASGQFDAITASDPQIMPPLVQARQERSSFAARLRALLKRELLQKIRNPEVLMTQIMGATVLGLIMGSIYYQMAPTQVFDKTAGISFAAIMTMFLVFHLVLLFPNERKIWLRDRDNGLYGALEYYVSVVVAGLPGDLMAAFVISTTLYWMFGLRADPAKYFTWIGFFFLLEFVAGSLMYFGGSLAPTTSAANSIVSVILLFVMVFVRHHFLLFALKSR
jgi:ABC-type multidrug transport system ATPase subunit